MLVFSSITIPFKYVDNVTFYEGIKMPGKLFRPRGKFKRTGRDSWITTVWYHSKKSAVNAVSVFNAERNHTNIRIIESTSSGTYKGKHIMANQIDRYYE